MTGWQKRDATALLILADGTILRGHAVGGKTGDTDSAIVGEVCFNTAITGYQEILTDPSYAGQIVTFTFPHIGNIGTNPQDMETISLAATSGVRGAVFRADITDPSNYRSAGHFDDWLKKRNIMAIAGIDTRALTAHIRENGLTNGIIAHAADGNFDIAALKAELAAFSGLEGMDLTKEVTCGQTFSWTETKWDWENGFGIQKNGTYHVVALDFGAKRNILRCLASQDARVTVVPATTSAEDILAMQPDGIFLSNGPGDPAATGTYAVPTIQKLIASGKPVFGICLGHQMLALALGGKTIKMHQGHHGANHPVKDLTTGIVEITSMNHGFAVDGDSLPDGVTQTHISLFDETNCGLSVDGKPIFSVQHHPEASPGPQDSHYLFARFLNLVRAQKGHALVKENSLNA